MSKVKAIEEAQRAGEAAMDSVLSYIRTSPSPMCTEAREVIETTLKKLGCESPEGIIVAGGRESAEPHAKGEGRLKAHEPIVIDIFPRNKKSGYFADMTRTILLGEPPERLQKMYDAVLGAEVLAISMIKPGVVAKSIQQAVEKYFEDLGFFLKNPRPKGEKGWLAEEGFIHSIGHGVGKKIHEPPSFGSDAVLKEGVVVTVEPGLYYKDIGGVRIEDMVLITKNGCRNLTKYPKQLSL